MNLKEYQEKAAEFAVYESSLYPVLALAEEVGELTTFFAKQARGDFKEMNFRMKKLLRKEIGDVLWQVSAIASDQGWNLEEIAIENLDKLQDRKDRRLIKGTGDER